MHATIAPCCANPQCGGVMMKIDRGVASHLLAVLCPEKYLRKDVPPEIHAELQEFAEQFAADIAVAMTTRTNICVRNDEEMTEEELGVRLQAALEMFQEAFGAATRHVVFPRNLN